MMALLNTNNARSFMYWTPPQLLSNFKTNNCWIQGIGIVLQAEW